MDLVYWTAKCENLYLSQCVENKIINGWGADMAEGHMVCGWPSEMEPDRDVSLMCQTSLWIT